MLTLEEIINGTPGALGILRDVLRIKGNEAKGNLKKYAKDKVSDLAQLLDSDEEDDEYNDPSLEYNIKQRITPRMQYNESEFNARKPKTLADLLRRR